MYALRIDDRLKLILLKFDSKVIGYFPLQGMNGHHLQYLQNEVHWNLHCFFIFILFFQMTTNPFHRCYTFVYIN